MPGRARGVEEGPADLVELLDELEPAQLEPALGVRDQDGGEGDVVVASPGVVVQEQQRLNDVVQTKAHFGGESLSDTV